MSDFEMEPELRRAYEWLGHQKQQFENLIQALVPVGSTVAYHHSRRPVVAVVLAVDTAKGRVTVRDQKTGWEGDVTLTRVEEIDRPRIIKLS